MWSDNLGELTTDDVKYSFERMLKTDWSARWPTLDHVEVKDKYSGVIVLKSPFDGTFLMGVASESGSILPKAAMLKLKDQKFTTAASRPARALHHGLLDAQAEGRC